MKLKLALATATALGLFMGGAYAGSNNNSFIDQSGTGNQASIAQSTGSNNDAGSASLRMKQGLDRAGTVSGGQNNAMTLTQTGNDNKIGTVGSGLEQYQKNNVLTIDQQTSANRVNQVRQSGVSLTGNTAAITQKGANGRNIVTSATQHNSGGGGHTLTITQDGGFNHIGQIDNVFNPQQTAAGVFQQGGLNDADVTQTGQYNRITRIDQSNAAPTLVVTQAGDYNAIGSLTQTGGAGNSMTLSFTGNDNGVGAAVAGANGFKAIGAYGIGTFAGAAMAATATNPVIAQGSAYQKGAGNLLSYVATGDRNLFGFRQLGAGNDIGGGSFYGDGNQVGVNQEGNGNNADFFHDGSGNDIGIRQLSSNNAATANLTGSFNQVSIKQFGGDGNVASASIAGDGNGGGALQGAAGSLAFDHGLESGQIIQDGISNNASLTITGAGSNQFAFLQDGNDNDIIGAVSGAGSNSATMVQIGNTNTASFTQSGGGNMVSVNQ